MRSDPKNTGKGKCEFLIKKPVTFCLSKGEEKQILLETCKLCFLLAAAANHTGFLAESRLSIRGLCGHTLR